MGWLARGLAVLSLLLPAACVPALHPAGPDRQQPQMLADALIMADGARLPLRRWLPPGETRAVVIALHGMNDYSNAYDGPGKVLAGQGLAVFAYDQRGFGQTAEPGRWAGSRTLQDDLLTAIRLVSAQAPGKPVFVLGESMGGAVAMTALARPDAPKIDGLILSAPAVWGRRDMGFFQRSLLWLASYTVPWMHLTGSGLKIMPSDNIEMLRALGRDPLVIKETRVEAVHGMVDLMDEAQAAAPKLALPVLMLYGEKDEIIPAAPSLRAAGQMPGARLALYARGYHMLMRDLQARTVLDDIAAWTADAAAPLPSAADRHAGDVLSKGPVTP